MVQQLAVHSCEVGLNLLPWIWSRSSLAFHQSLLYLIPGNANGLGKSTFIVSRYRRPFRDYAVRSMDNIASILALCRLTYVICFPACAYWQGHEFRFFPQSVSICATNMFCFTVISTNYSTDTLLTVLIIASPPINPIHFPYFSDSGRPLATNLVRGHRVTCRRRCGNRQRSRDRDGRRAGEF